MAADSRRWDLYAFHAGCEQHGRKSVPVGSGDSLPESPDRSSVPGAVASMAADPSLPAIFTQRFKIPAGNSPPHFSLKIAMIDENLHQPISISLNTSSPQSL